MARDSRKRDTFIHVICVRIPSKVHTLDSGTPITNTILHSYFENSFTYIYSGTMRIDPPGTHPHHHSLRGAATARHAASRCQQEGGIRRSLAKTYTTIVYVLLRAGRAVACTTQTVRTYRDLFMSGSSSWRSAATRLILDAPAATMKRAPRGAPHHGTASSSASTVHSAIGTWGL